jgi:transcriptional regulator with XRE-family HTH domain
MEQEKTYSTKEVAKLLKVSDRTVARYLNSYFTVDTKGYHISEKMLNILEREYGTNEDMVVESFSTEEYEEFQKRLIEYPLLKEQMEHLKSQIEYHTKSSESILRQMEILINSIQQRNYIEAKEKGFDEPNP